MKATDLLESQHRKVEALFKKLEGGRSDATATLEELANSLAAHMAIEQDIFYPMIKEVDEELVQESFEEHALAEIALKRLLLTDPEDESFDARVTALKELIEHHVKEEEEELFPEVEKKIDEDELKTVGKTMKTRFDEVFAEGYEAAVPKGMSKTSADVAKKKLSKSRAA
jgi:hemerythrin-like domain-containing protein